MKKTHKTGDLILAGLGVSILISVVLSDHFLGYRSVFDEGKPDFSMYFLLRIASIGSAVFLVIKGIISRMAIELDLMEGKDARLSKLVIYTVLTFNVLILALFIIDRSKFSTQSLEDGPVEWASAIFLFLSSIVLVLGCLSSVRRSSLNRLMKFMLIVLAALFFVMGMEEISWLQRVVGYETPTIFEENLQEEFNFHNFSTNLIENLYYFGSFVFLIVLPFFRFVFPAMIKRLGVLRLFISRPFIIPLAAIPFAYNYDMWNGVFTQIAFFGSLFALIYMTIASGTFSERLLVGISAVIFVLTQSIYLFSGKNYTRIWEITEYKEFLIPLAFLVYSVDVFARTKNHRVDVQIYK